jgi:hypothetical protein
VNAETTAKLISGTDQSDLTSGNACWETAPLVFAKLNEDFGPFDVDLTADARRTLVPGAWFGPGSPSGEYDALLATWLRYANGYSNPPYGPFIQKILPRAAEMASEHAFTTTLLLPLRVTKAFKRYILPLASDLLFCDTRLTFFENGVPRLNEKRWVDDGKAVADPAVFDSIIVRYGPGTKRLNVGIWNVPKHVTKDDLARAVDRRNEQPKVIDLMGALRKALSGLPEPPPNETVKKGMC